MNKTPLLDLSSLEKAVGSLDEAVVEYQKNTLNRFVRDASIQRFEYTYELCHKMLKRYLEISEPNAEEIDQMSFPALIRTASERGIVLHGWDQWRIYRDARNITSHTYNEDKAVKVCEAIPDFLLEARTLLTELQKRVAVL